MICEKEKNRGNSLAMPPPQDKRVTLSVNLTSKAREMVEKIREETGVPATTATERFFEWLAGMSPKFRLAVLNRDQSAQDELLIAWIREHFAAKGVGAEEIAPDDVTGRIKLINRLLAELQSTMLGLTDAAASAKKGKKG